MSVRIHPTAVVEQGAQLDTGVVIGAFAYIGPRVQIGADSVVHHHATVENQVYIGAECEVFPYALIGGLTQDLKYTGADTGIKIGSRNILREYTSVHIATKEGEYTTLGDDNVLLAYSHIAHDCEVGNHLIMSSHAALAGHVRLGDHINISWNSGVHQFCNVGDYAMIGGCSKVVQDVPPYMLADGNPARVKTINKIGLERAGFSSEEIALARSAYKCLYRETHSREEALLKLHNHKEASGRVLQTILNFVEQSARGLA